MLTPVIESLRPEETDSKPSSVGPAKSTGLIVTVSFLAYRTVDGASPNTTTMLDFRTLEEARRVAASDHLKTILQEIRSTGVDHPRVLVVERSPFTPEPLRP